MVFQLPLTLPPLSFWVLAHLSPNFWVTGQRPPSKNPKSLVLVVYSPPSHFGASFASKPKFFACLTPFLEMSPPLCCFICLNTSIMILFLSPKQFVKSSIERRAPIVNDAITSNETLAAARNAFLIGHLFAEFEEDERKRKAETEKESSKPMAESEADSEGIYGELKGKMGGEGGNEGDDSREEQGYNERVGNNQNEGLQASILAKTTANGEDEENGKEGNDRQMETAPIKPVNIPTNPTQTQSHPAAREEADDGRNDAVPLARPIAIQSTELTSDDGLTVNGTTQLPSTDGEEDATNPFIYPPTLNPQLAEGDEGGQPEWLKALFFTGICTGIGFFLLMLLIALIGRFEGNADGGPPSQQQPMRITIRAPGDSRIVPIIEKEPARLSAAR